MTISIANYDLLFPMDVDKKAIHLAVKWCTVYPGRANYNQQAGLGPSRAVDRFTKQTRKMVV